MIRLALPAALLATPALAATGDYGFFSLRNTDFVVTIGFVIFLGILFYFKVPSKLLGMLDDRATGIRKDLDEAKSLRDEAKALLADYERKTREARAQADEIVATAKAEAEASNVQAKKDLEASVQRRLATAGEQIESARAAAVKEVRDQAIMVATAVAADVLAKQTTASDADAMIDRSIDTVRERLH
ncbi:F0F1 ATP synthase subunit B [Jannaschia formosa]|uniref:F0F1 ATP synthase subunit B n=1 Tax=Jannaschia formosa TaxID=2259592 RepID=UPI000E1C0878|nr:F0F1 ATP synthase subunit B [Jannaschia formosa]TFL17955.1 F0F1 ATP synthase subunit B [Jannaschia formosa]